MGVKSQRQRVLRWLAATVTLFVGLAPVFGVESIEYNRDVRPILAENCFACHGADSAARKADLRLDQQEAAFDFGAIVPNEPDESELYLRVVSDDADLLMPPPETKKKLTVDEISILKRWIRAGAEYQPHWSLIAPEQSQFPTVDHESWVKNGIDRFVLAKLEENRLTPAPEADSHTFFRRLHLDVTGLPPSIDDAQRFAEDYERDQDQAVSDWTDRLMDSSSWGEHRARYWLDAARYGDTHGMHFDNYREMWPYRDWVIRAFNSNQPFDQFTVEQIAGDLLPDPTDDQLIATGFQRCNMTTNEGGTIDEENLALYAADRVQTFGWVYLGLTTNCAQCHDHKFDSLTMKDYYSLAAFFRNTTQQAKDGNVKDGRGPVLVVPRIRDQKRWKRLPAEIAAATQMRDARRESAREEFSVWQETLNQQSPVVPSDGIVVHLPLTEGAGEVVRSTCDPSQVIKATGDVAWVDDGKLGPAPVVKLGSTFDLGSLGDFEKDQPFSYGAWIRPGKGNSSGGIIARLDEQQEFRGWDLWQQGNMLSVHLVDVWPNNALKVTTRRGVLKPGVWRHVFATYDGSGTPGGIRIYVDGVEQPLRVEQSSLTADATIRTSTSLRIGQRSDSQGYRGGIQDVRVFRRDLSAREVKALAIGTPIGRLLTIPADQLTDEESQSIFEYYLNVEDNEFSELEKKVADLQAERDAIRRRSAITHIQKERMDTAAKANVLMRGEYDQPGDEVLAATPAALHAMPDGSQADRLGLARWVVDPANPLTSRVIVNQFWQQVFGQGIVSTPEDFGVMGAPPTHPQLLDWLAIEFQQSNWDVKRLFKLMLTSATYRQAAVVTANKLEVDRDNALLSRGPRFRMDAEMVRDCALSASGLLSKKMYGPSVKPYQPEAIWDIVGLPGGDTRDYEQDQGEDIYRRSLYTFWKRMAPPPNLEAFNAPSREVCTIRRERTNTPLQAFVTLNDPQFVEAARRLAELALKETSDTDAALDFIARRTLARSLDPKETAMLQEDQTLYHGYYAKHPDDAKALVSVGDSIADPNVSTISLAAWTMVCNQFLNLDETLNK